MNKKTYITPCMHVHDLCVMCGNLNPSSGNTNTTNAADDQNKQITGPTIEGELEGDGPEAKGSFFNSEW